MKYLNFSKEDQILFMKLVKERSGLKWEKLAHFLGIHRSMIFFYLNGKSKISYENYEKLCNLAKIKQSFKSYIFIKNKIQPINKIDVINNHLAELLGILAGDGHISNINYEVCVSGHMILDKEYINKNVVFLFERLFGLNPKLKIYKPYNNLRCCVNSKLLIEYLSKEFNLPIGKKKGNLHIPKQIIENKLLLKYYIRGLFDTDGSVYLRRKKDIVISIISGDLLFLNEIKNALKILEYNPCVSGKNIYLYKKEEVRRFFSEIKPINKKHLDRYSNFLKLQTTLNL